MILAGLPFLMGGCAAQRPPLSEEPHAPGEGWVHVYRLEGPVGRLIGAGFFIDDHNLVFHSRNVVLRQREYSSFRLSPGAHTFRMHGTFPADSSVMLEIDVVPGETEYLRLTSDSVGWRFEKVGLTIGKSEIETCRYRAPARLPAEAIGARRGGGRP